MLYALERTNRGSNNQEFSTKLYFYKETNFCTDLFSYF